MIETVCNYALLRFLPYRDTGEFINIGVVLACGEQGFLDFRVEMQHWTRVSHFFPELDMNDYHTGLHALCNEFDRWRQSVAVLRERPPEQRETLLRNIFNEITRPRESLFFFSPSRTLLARDPAVALDKLFEHYVGRRFAVVPTHGQELRLLGNVQAQVSSQ